MTQTLTEAVAPDAGLPEADEGTRGVRKEALLRALETLSQIPMPGQLRAVAYLRISTEDQKKGFGVAYTGKRVVRHIAKKGWALTDVFADEGFSGTLPAEQRPDLKELVRQAQLRPRPFDVVVVYEERAIGRAGRAFWPWVWRLQEIGIFTAVVCGDYDNTTEDGESRMRKAADRAEDELITVRNRMQGGLQEKAEAMCEEGAYLGGSVPYGYRVKNKGVLGESCLVPDECDCGEECARLHEANGARLAVSRFVATVMYGKTGDDLNAAGYRRKNGQLWDYQSVHNLLHSKALIEAVTVHRGSKDVVLDQEGNPRYGQTVEIKLKPILTPAERTALKEAKAKRPRRREPKRFVYTLAGRVKSPCGQVYVGGGKSRQGDLHGRSPFKAMKCSGDCNKPKAERCMCPLIRAEPVEKEAWRLVRSFLEDPERLEQKASEALEARRASQADYAGRLKKLVKSISDVEESIDLMLMAATQQAQARKMSRGEAAEYMTRMTASSNAELADLQRQHAEVEQWQSEGECVEDRAEQLRQLAAKARVRLAAKTLEEQAELFDLLQAEVMVVGDVLSRPLGRPCRAVGFFADRGLDVPHLTDEAWAAVADLVPVFSPRYPSRDILAAFLEKARTGAAWKALDSAVPHTTLTNHWIRWGLTGGMEPVAARLTDFPGSAPPDYDKVILQVRCTILPEVLLGSVSGGDDNGALSSSDGSSAGANRNRTESPDRVAGR